MILEGRNDVLIVLYRTEGSSLQRDERRLRLPVGADLPDLLAELERESPALHLEVRDRILRAAGRVLAYGADDGLLTSLTRQLSAGGPIVFPADDRTDPTAQVGA